MHTLYVINFTKTLTSTMKNGNKMTINKPNLKNM